MLNLGLISTTQIPTTTETIIEIGRDNPGFKMTVVTVSIKGNKDERELINRIESAVKREVNRINKDTNG